MRSCVREWGNDLKNRTDEELIRALRGGEDGCMDTLIQRYKDMVRIKAGTMRILGADRDDVIQEGMIGLFKAIREYDENKEAAFKTFADVCVSRQMYEAIRKANRKKHIPLNNYISLYSDRQSAEGDDMMPRLDAIASVTEINPEEMLLKKETLKRLEGGISEVLSSMERQVVELYLTGMDLKEIGSVLEKDVKSTGNAFQRAKAKLKKYLEEE